MSKSKTPMEQQYDALKDKHQDKLLLFRLGDFYEMFNEDALIASNILNIAMTKRQGRTMCGFPHHALDQYAYKLVEAGYKVAICEQVEDAAQAKGLVKRDVVSVLTKGTWSENPLLDHSVNSFLAIISFQDSEIAIVFADVSTGDIILSSYKNEHVLRFLLDELSRFSPVETICTKSFLDHFPIEEELKIYQSTLRIMDDHYFYENQLYHTYIKNHSSLIKILSSVQNNALQGLFVYLEENHFSLESVKHFKMPYQYKLDETLFMNEDTLKHLELVINTQDSTTKNTLFSVINKTKTMPASRKLRRMLVAPSANLSDILNQQERTEYFYLSHTSTQGISELLKGMSDLERLISRLITGKILPRECLALAETVRLSEKLKDFLYTAEPFQKYLAALKSFDQFVEKILKSISGECSNTIDGTVIQKGINKELDELKEILNDSKTFLIKLQEKERLETGISTLKIAYNKIYGYYIEISKGASKNVPSHYMRKQSLVNAERFTIPELDEFEQKMLQAENSVVSLENNIYDELVVELQKYYEDLIPLSEFITEVDLRLGLAIVARDQRFVKPIINDGFNWNIQEGRHPIVESILKKERFVANNTNIDRNKSRVLIVTGPNMAGKSTYLRQNALFAVLAQIGSFVPAQKAEIGIVDKIFTRIGAADDLSSGRSTFYVEMEEAAFIVNHATPKSLVIMDELGRGTSTQDGLALAWAILEHFIINPNKKCKLFFSTHYHELTEISKFESVTNLCMAIQESNGKPIFLRKVIEGQASKSYGVHVAEMAGLDKTIVARASNILLELKKGTFFYKKQKNEQPQLFANEYDADKIKKDNIYQKIISINPNELTPLESLQTLFEIINLTK